MSETLKRALNARVGDVLATPTPLDAAPMLSVRVGRPVLLKREDLTPIFSFKSAARSTAWRSSAPPSSRPASSPRPPAITPRGSPTVPR